MKATRVVKIDSAGAITQKKTRTGQQILRESREHLYSLQIAALCHPRLQNHLYLSGHKSLILQCLFMPAFSYLTSACFYTDGFANPLIFGPIPCGFRRTAQEGKAKRLQAFPELRAPDIFYHVYLSVTCVFQPLSLVPYAQNSSITSGFGSHRFAKFDVDHLHKVKPHPFLLIDVMMTNQTLSSTFRKEELL